MQLAFIDLETYWDQEHTLSKMSPVAYCQSPKTELISMAIKIDHYPCDVIFGEKDIRHVVSKLDWSTKMVIAHNGSEFDHMILAWRLGIRPRMWGCTLAMARPLFAKTVGLGLGKLVAHFGLGAKDAAILHSTRGKRLADFTPEELRAMEVYNKADTNQCAALFHKLLPYYTPAELWHIDCNIRMLVEPVFDLDTGLLQAAASVERANKHKALTDLARLLRREVADPDPSFWDNSEAVAEWVREQMASAPKFSAILQSRGVEVPLKQSKTDPSKKIPALAKTDEAMEELIDSDDEVVAAAARARLSAKSTQLETRIQSFLDTFQAVGSLPVPAKYCGADTTGRDSGFLYNMLNLPRINPDKPKTSDALRKAVRAPKGKVVMVTDQSGIELRVNHTLWKVRRSMDMWKAKPNADLYRKTAAHMYSITEDEVAKPQRHYAKILELACLAEGTLVLTRGGPVPIERVSAADEVWDGSCWVRQEGPICRGTREVTPHLGVAMTPDHAVWTGGSFRAWGEVCADQILLQQALCSASLPCSGGSISRTQTTERGTPPCAVAPAGGRESCSGLTSSTGAAQGAVDVGAVERPAPECETPQSTSCHAGRRAAVCSVDWRRQSTGATTRTTRVSATTGAEASPSAPSGASASGCSLNTSPPCPAGTREGSTWTESTTIAGTSPATSDSCLALTTAETVEPCAPSNGGLPSLRPKSRVYDLVNCGPKNRFAVLTDAGLLIVHNCGYQQGAKTFRQTARVQGGIRLTLPEADHGVKFWRSRYPEIAGYRTGGWAICHDSLEYIARGDKVYIDPWELCSTEKDAIVLPSGRRILYPDLRQEWVDKWEEVDGEMVQTKELAWLYGQGRHRAFIYGGKVDENVVQALSRDIIFPNAIDFWKRTKLRPAHKVYDELVYVVDPSVASELLDMLQSIMRTPPPWWPELVLWSEGDIAETYGDAK